jgi:CubicO group peptidase (beta-lactamase class C family)
MNEIFKVFGGLMGVIVVVIFGIVLLQVDFSNDQNLDKFIETKMEALEAKGLAVAFIKDGDITWSKNYGYADVEAGIKVNDQTIFQVASVSKPVTGVAVMQLSEKGLIDLDESVNRYVPFQIVNPNFPDKKITVRMLMQHTSGLIDNDPVYRSTFTLLSGAPDPEMTLEELARSYYLEGGDLYDARGNFSKSQPGEERSYSNIAFGLLGLIVEQVSGLAFHVYCKENIFLPLGMMSTGWLSTEVNLERMAVQYDGGTRLKPYAVASYPDGGLKTTVMDYSKFLMAIMHDGNYRGHRVLKAASIKEMMPDNPEDNLVWVADVFSELFVDTKGRPVPGHLGGDPGVSTFVGYNPLNGVGMIVFMNGATSLITPSPFLMVKMLNYRSPYKRLGVEAGLLQAD